MEIGIVGLGRMGANMARRLSRGGVHVICYDHAKTLDEKNIECTENLAALCARVARYGHT